MVADTGARENHSAQVLRTMLFARHSVSKTLLGLLGQFLPVCTGEYCIL